MGSIMEKVMAADFIRGDLLGVVLDGDDVEQLGYSQLDHDFILGFGHQNAIG
ncbi:CusA/CzcA family heavy metal efflux RND transporter [Sesbania bispinosa]|nr:CusA/CzcA family heavy metal efflux RND transporter [Sesbania bispinosa]